MRCCNKALQQTVKAPTKSTCGNRGGRGEKRKEQVHFNDNDECLIAAARTRASENPSCVHLDRNVLTVIHAPHASGCGERVPQEEV